MTADFQGSSELTPRKEFEIGGLSWMRLQQYKNQYFTKSFDKVIMADIFCGTGKNEVGGEIVDGSPIKIVNAIARTRNMPVKVDFWFSDIRRVACEVLKENVYQSTGLVVDALPVEAADAIEILAGILDQEPRTYLYLVIDPNGPKDFPRDEVVALLQLFSSRVDVVPYISATSVNRCIAARKKAGMQFKSWLAGIENFDSGFVAALSNNRKGWIREHVPGDRQRWTMLPTFGRMPPSSDWKKQGYVELDSDRGRRAVDFYCGEMR